MKFELTPRPMLAGADTPRPTAAALPLAETQSCSTKLLPHNSDVNRNNGNNAITIYSKSRANIQIHKEFVYHMKMNNKPMSALLEIITFLFRFVISVEEYNKIGTKVFSFLDDELVKRTENDVLEAKRNKMLTGRVELGAIINPVKNNAVNILRQTTVYPFNFKENKYQCALCRKDFEDPELFRVHVDTNHQKNDRAIILSKVKKQFRIDITNMKCRVCARPFNDLNLIVKHLKDDHGFKLDPAESLGLVPVRLDKNRFVCVVCDKKYTGFKALSAHTGTHFQRSVCHICGQRFETKSGVQSHVYRTHLIACIVCKKKFETAKERIEHVRSSNAKCFPFKCNRCEKRFLVWEQREDHCVNDHGTQRIEFPCKDCGEVFQHRCKLYFHFKMAHTDDTKCTECNRVFGWRKQLEEHMLVHSGIKPFQCDVCSKTFTRKKNFQRHVIIHDDSKKLLCTHCNRLFVAKHRLVSHIKLRHPDVCNDEFANADKRK